MIKKSILIRQLKCKNYNITLSKLKNILLSLKYLLIQNLKKILKKFSLKKRLLILNIIKKSYLKSNFNEKYLIIKIFANKGLTLKKRQAQAKGKGVIIKKKLSHLTIILTQLKLYKTFTFSNIII